MTENKFTPFGISNEDEIIKYISKIKTNKEIPLSKKQLILNMNQKYMFVNKSSRN